jgi:hypothetical protein
MMTTGKKSARRVSGVRSGGHTARAFAKPSSGVGPAVADEPARPSYKIHVVQWTGGKTERTRVVAPRVHQGR